MHVGGFFDLVWVRVAYLVWTFGLIGLWVVCYNFCENVHVVHHCDPRDALLAVRLTTDGARLPPALAAPPAVSAKPVSDAVRSRNPSKSTLTLDAVAAAVSHKHHSIIRVCAGLIQLVYWSLELMQFILFIPIYF